MVANVSSALPRASFQMLFPEVEVSKGVIHGNVALLVLQSGGAYLLSIAHEVAQHTPTVPYTKRGTMHNVVRLKIEQETAKIIERHQLAVIDERA